MEKSQDENNSRKMGYYTNSINLSGGVTCDQSDEILVLSNYYIRKVLMRFISKNDPKTTDFEDFLAFFG